MASLIKRARASHAHASPLLRAQRTSAHRGDTEAPRMPCCANNTTAHVRDISFYYYPSVRSLPFPLPPAPTNLSTVLLAPSLPRPFLLFLESPLLLFFLSLSLSTPPFTPFQPFFFFHQRYYFSSSSRCPFAPRLLEYLEAIPFASPAKR